MTTALELFSFKSWCSLLLDLTHCKVGEMIMCTFKVSGERILFKKRMKKKHKKQTGRACHEVDTPTVAVVMFLLEPPRSGV